MKKSITVFMVLSATAFGFYGCGNGSIESDAKRVAELQCKAQKLMERAASGDVSVATESTQLLTEATALSNEMEGKYTSESDKKKFSEALLKEMGNCK